MKITIIGAGIGGLTTAIALKQKGFEVEVFESTSEFKKAGSGINLAINAMQIYKKLGVYDTLIQKGSYTSVMNLTDPKLNIISGIDLVPSEKKYNTKTIAIHRAVLHEVLLEKLNDTPIHLNKRLKNLVEVENKVNLTFEDGTTHQSDIVIGADGLNSAVRNSIFGDCEIRRAKQVCWRGITQVQLPEKYQIELNEMWGIGKRFGFVHIDKKNVYWFALTNYKNDYKKEFGNADLQKVFYDFDPIVNEIISSTDKNVIILNEIADLKPISSWSKGRVCLLGDAAHATTPNLGQGACQAIESAYVFAKCLSENKDYQVTFKKYQNMRKKSAIEVVNTSWRIGRISQLENSLGIKLRNGIMSAIPKKMVQKQSTAMFELDYLVY